MQIRSLIFVPSYFFEGSGELFVFCRKMSSFHSGFRFFQLFRKLVLKCAIGCNGQINFQQVQILRRRKSEIVMIKRRIRRLLKNLMVALTSEQKIVNLKVVLAGMDGSSKKLAKPHKNYVGASAPFSAFILRVIIKLVSYFNQNFSNSNFFPHARQMPPLFQQQLLSFSFPPRILHNGVSTHYVLVIKKNPADSFPRSTVFPTDCPAPVHGFSPGVRCKHVATVSSTCVFHVSPLLQKQKVNKRGTS